jgi:vancomycin resistance protein VanW
MPRLATSTKQHTVVTYSQVAPVLADVAVDTPSIPNDIQSSILNQIIEREAPNQRVALSSRFPLFKHPILEVRRAQRKFEAVKNYRSEKLVKQSQKFNAVVARHQSVLLRKLGDSDLRLQVQKVQNLRTAAKALDGLVIQPGQTFSLWRHLGRPTSTRGYVKGMLLSQGRVVEGMGGGLCQLANFLFWIFLHADIEVVERHHHSMDVFPDSGRVLPFGSGATIMYNFIDLKIKNTSDQPLQLSMWLTDTHLKGQLLSPAHSVSKYHVGQRYHCFIEKDGSFYRYNQIWREKRQNGILLEEQHMVTNLAPVLYSTSRSELEAAGHRVIAFSELSK